MKFSAELYTGESISSAIDEIKAAITDYDVAFRSEYLICVAQNPNNLFEIIPVRELRLQVYREYDLKIVGLAGSKDEAVELVRQMIEKMYSENIGAADIFS